MELLIILLVVGVVIGGVYFLKKYFNINKYEDLTDEDDYLNRRIKKDEDNEQK